jgi:pyruvate,water dikinase
VVGASARERAKDVFIRELSGMRSVFDELAARAQARGGPADRRDCYLVTIDELGEFVRDPTEFAAVIAERAEQRDFLQARIPPFWFEGRIPNPDSWELRASRSPGVPFTGTLQGMGVCGGVASGPARVILDPGDPRDIQPGDILVAPITDPAWTPLFLSAAAVVVDVGAQQSHAAIVARELGIPAVVSVTSASRTIADGMWLEVDGDRGLVTVHALP